MDSHPGTNWQTTARASENADSKNISPVPWQKGLQQMLRYSKCFETHNCLVHLKHGILIESQPSKQLTSKSRQQGTNLPRWSWSEKPTRTCTIGKLCQHAVLTRCANMLWIILNTIAQSTLGSPKWQKGGVRFTATSCARACAFSIKILVAARFLLVALKLLTLQALSGRLQMSSRWDNSTQTVVKKTVLRTGNILLLHIYDLICS